DPGVHPGVVGGGHRVTGVPVHGQRVAVRAEQGGDRGGREGEGVRAAAGNQIDHVDVADRRIGGEVQRLRTRQAQRVGAGAAVDRVACGVDQRVIANAAVDVVHRRGAGEHVVPVVAG